MSNNGKDTNYRRNSNMATTPLDIVLGITALLILGSGLVLLFKGMSNF